jgi:hypothetical protein
VTRRHDTHPLQRHALIVLVLYYMHVYTLFLCIDSLEYFSCSHYTRLKISTRPNGHKASGRVRALQRNYIDDTCTFHDEFSTHLHFRRVGTFLFFWSVQWAVNQSGWMRSIYTHISVESWLDYIRCRVPPYMLHTLLIVKDNPEQL